MTRDPTNRPSSTSSVGAEHWVEAYADVLYRYAMGRVGQNHLAEDLVQETLLAALQARQSFRGDSQQRTWLIGILRHKIVDHFRSTVTRHEVQAEDDSGGDVMDSWFDEKGRWRRPPTPWKAEGEQLLEKGEFWEVFRQCMENLPERPRQVFALRVMDERETDEICKELKITATNLWVILHRARALLRACLEKHWFSEGNADSDVNR